MIHWWIGVNHRQRVLKAEKTFRETHKLPSQTWKEYGKRMELLAMDITPNIRDDVVIQRIIEEMSGITKAIVMQRNPLNMEEMLNALAVCDEASYGPGNPAPAERAVGEAPPQVDTKGRKNVFKKVVRRKNTPATPATTVASRVNTIYVDENGVEIPENEVEESDKVRFENTTTGIVSSQSLTGPSAQSDIHTQLLWELDKKLKDLTTQINQYEATIAAKEEKKVTVNAVSHSSSSRQSRSGNPHNPGNNRSNSSHSTSSRGNSSARSDRNSSKGHTPHPSGVRNRDDSTKRVVKETSEEVKQLKNMIVDIKEQTFNPNMECYNCHGKGHPSRLCPTPRRSNSIGRSNTGSSSGHGGQQRVPRDPSRCTDSRCTKPQCSTNSQGHGHHAHSTGGGHSTSGPYRTTAHSHVQSQTEN